VLAAVQRNAATSTLPLHIGSAEAELVALARGLKPLVRQVVNLSEADATERVLPEGVHAVRGGARDGRVVLYLARDPSLAHEAVAQEGHEGNAALGRLLGYPACCVEFFSRRLDSPLVRRRSNLALARAAAARTRSPVARLNALDLHLFHWISWAPCSFDCEPSRAWADTVAAAFLTHDAQGRARTAEGRTQARAFVERVDVLLGAHRVVWGEAQVSVLGERRGRRFVVRDAWPTWRDHPRRTLGEELSVRAVALAATLRATGLAPWDADLFSFDAG
jgi:hypothetical protein